jgi:NADH-quinone oxidoreductase subunit M
LAHVQAPTAGSVILAGILLKIGTYGFVRFNLPMLPDATAVCAPWLLWLSAIGIIYGAFVALAQTDIKRLIAYSSVSHLGYCMLGMFALNKLGMDGSVLQMINHGLSTGGLFAIVGMIYERYHTREIAKLGGLTKRTPILAFFLVLFTLSSVGLPGLNGFAGEFLILSGMFQRAWTGAPTGYLVQFVMIAAMAVFGVVLGAWYMLWLVERTFFGPLKEPHGDSHHPVQDMSMREVFALAPLVVFMFWIGLHPGFFVDRMKSTLDPLAVHSGKVFDELMQSEPPAVADNLRSASEIADAKLRTTTQLTKFKP